MFSCLSESLQLQCDKKHITAHVGGELNLICNYDPNLFRYSKKYWCKGHSRSTCTILVDSDSKTDNAHRSHIEVRSGLLRVKVKDLTLHDGGVYWVGIDKMYADIMTSIDVIITDGKNASQYQEGHILPPPTP